MFSIPTWKLDSSLLISTISCNNLSNTAHRSLSQNSVLFFLLLPLELQAEVGKMLSVITQPVFQFIVAQIFFNYMARIIFIASEINFVTTCFSTTKPMYHIRCLLLWQCPTCGTKYMHCGNKQSPNLDV